MKKLAIILMFVSLAACKSEIDNKPAATVDVPKTEEPAEKPEANTGEEKSVALDAAASSVGFVGAKITGDHTGDFKTISGTGTLVDGKLQKLEVDVDTTSVVADEVKLTNHLKSPDFFDVEKFPKAKFVSTSIEDGKVTGNMTIRGITKSISFPATIKDDGKAIQASSEFTLKRFDFDIAYKGKADDLIKDDVLMKLKLTFPKG